MHSLPRALALLGTGLLAGAFGYTLFSVVPTFDAVPLAVHLPFRVELMSMNSIVMQSLMALSFASSLWFTLTLRGRTRLTAAAAPLLAAATFLITRFGNVPINREIRTWSPTAPPAGYADRLQRWELFHDLRTATAVAAFLVVLLVTHQRYASPASPAEPGQSRLDDAI